MAIEASAWMEKNRDRPFFLNYWMFSVHAPFDAKQKLIEKYRAQADPASEQRSPTYAAMFDRYCFQCWQEDPIASCSGLEANHPGI